MGDGTEQDTWLFGELGAVLTVTRDVLGDDEDRLDPGHEIHGPADGGIASEPPVDQLASPRRGRARRSDERDRGVISVEGEEEALR